MCHQKWTRNQNNRLIVRSFNTCLSVALMIGLEHKAALLLKKWSRSWQGNPQKQLAWVCGRTWIIDQHLASLHGTYVGPLHVWDSSVTWSVCGAPSLSWLGSTYTYKAIYMGMESISHARLTCRTLMQGSGNLALPQLNVPHFVDSHSRLSLSGWRQRSQWGEEMGGEKRKKNGVGM